MKWFISYTLAPGGDVFAWATEAQPPRHATIRTMLDFPGEVHFEFGQTVDEARSRLEAALP